MGDSVKNPFIPASFLILQLAVTFSTLQAQGKGSVINFGNKWGWTGTNEAFVPQLVMYGTPANFHNNSAKIDLAVQTFMVDHGFNGFHISVACRWFDLDEEDCTSINGSNPNIDVRTFDALEDLITKTHAAGGMVHIWMWGDASRGQNPSVRPDWGGLNGSVEMNLLQEIANRLGPLPGWTMGYGYDVDEWATQAQATTWHNSLQSFLPQFHFLGARPAGPNNGTNHSPFISWNQGFDYSSYEHHQPAYDVYVAALDALPGKPVMSEDRFRIRNPPQSKDYTPDETRQGLWSSTMAGGVANIWGNLTNGGSFATGSAPYPNAEQIKTYSLFFENRFKKDMTSSSSGTVRSLTRPSNTDYIFYQNSTSSIQIDLSGMVGSQPAVAIDVKLSYAEIALGNLNPGNQTWIAPYTSDWAIAVGDFIENQPPLADAGPDQTVTDIDNNDSEDVTLDGSGSFDPAGSIVNYVWNEGGGQIATGVNPPVKLNLGTHNIDLTVTDDDGATDTDQVIITVNSPPIADAGSDQTVTDIDNNDSEDVTLDGSGSFDPAGSIVSYVWNENGNQIATGVDSMVTLNVGTHNIDLTVTDDLGATDSDTLVITVNSPLIFRVERSTGDVFARGSFIGGGADLAERISVSEPVLPGDLVELDPNKPRHYRKARGSSQLVAGVITTRPGFTLGNNSAQPLQLKGMTAEKGLRFGAEVRPMLALIGRVPMKATTQNGPIRPGDLLTVSSKPGYAMRCAEPQACAGVIGKALEALERGQGSILVLLMTH